MSDESVNSTRKYSRCLELLRLNRWVNVIQMVAYMGVILGPSSPNWAAWSDADSDGYNETWTDPQTQEVTHLDTMNGIYFDLDDDGASNEEEADENTNPYKLDTDLDGLSDGDELHIARLVIPGLSPVLWDSDGDFRSDYDEYHSCDWVVYANGQLPSLPNATYYDYDGDGLHNPVDPLYDDPSNLSPVNAIAWGAQAWGDADWDGELNFDDADPYSLADFDGDGVPDVVDPFPTDPSNYSQVNYIIWAGDVLGDADADGIPNHADTDPMPVSADLDRDGIENPLDPFPLDAANHSEVNGQDWYGEVLLDFDGDLIENWRDPAPYSDINSFNGHDWRGEVLGDADLDGVPNWQDLSPFPLEVDEDGDGLTLPEEISYGTSDQDVDGDDDGLTDKEELQVYFTDPLDAHSLSVAQGFGTLYLDFDLVEQVDADDDGIPRRIEQLYGLNDSVAADALGDLDGNGVTNIDQYLAGVALDGGLGAFDLDRDGMTDVFENLHHFDPSDPADAVLDADNDSVMNYEEAKWGLNPHLADTHGAGGLGDLQYLMAQLLYPTGNSPALDSDADGIPDWAEQALNGVTICFARRAPGDLDGDALSDVWEHRYGKGRYPANGLDPRVQQAAGDPDSDGLTNLLEYHHGRHPLMADAPGGNANSGPQFVSLPAAVLPPGAPGAPAPQAPEWSGSTSGNNAGSGGGVAAPPLSVAVGAPVDKSFTDYVYPAGMNGNGEKGQDEAQSGVLQHLDYTNTLIQGDTQHVSYWNLDRSGLPSIDGSPSPLTMEVGNWSAMFPGGAALYPHASTEKWPQGTSDLYDMDPGGSGAVVGTQTHHDNWIRSAMNFRRTISQSSSRWWRYYYNKVRYLTVDGQVQPVEFLEKVCLTIEPGEQKSQTIWLAASLPDALEHGVTEEVSLHAIDASGDPQKGYRVSASDAAGPAYRKVGLNGMPLKDSKPQIKDEAGELPEETYVDAYTRQLVHSVSDVYASVESSLLPLAVRRDARESVWSERHGLRPSEVPDTPFGPGWSSSLCASIRFEENFRQADVTDEQGAHTRFFRSIPTLPGVPQGSHVWVHSREEKQQSRTAYDTLETLTDGNGAPTGFILRKKYGTVCTYELTPLRQGFSTDRVDGSYKSVQYRYARLTKVKDRWNNELHYTYPSTSTLIPKKIHDPDRSSQVVWIRQNNGVVTSVRGPGGQLVTYNYETRSQGGQELRCLTSVTRGGGRVEYRYSFAGESPPPGDGDPDGPLEANYQHVVLDRIKNEKGRSYTFDYDFNHGNKAFEVSGSDFKLRSQLGLSQLVKKITLPNNAGVNFGGNRDIRTQKDATLAQANVQTVVSSACGTYTYTFSQPDVFVPLANDPGREDDPYSKQLTVFFSRLEIDTPAGDEIYTFDFDHGMALTSARDISNNTTHFNYGSVGPDGLGWDDPVEQVNALGRSRSFTYDSDTRVMKSMTDEQGTLTSYVVNSTTGLRTKETVSKGGSVLRVTDFDYGSGGFTGFLASTTVQSTSATGGDLVTQYTPDANGRVKKQIVKAGGGMDLITSFTYTGNGSKKTVTNPRGHTTTFDYDAQSLRLEKIENPDGTERTLDYDAHGNLMKEVNEKGLVTTHVYDVLHRCTQTIVHLPEGNLTSSVTYNAFNLPVTATDARGTVTSCTYDNIGRRLTTTVGSGAQAQTTTFTYGTNSGGSVFDVSGFKPTTVKDPRNHVTTNTYDDLYRLTVQDGPEGHKITTTYDHVGNPTEVKDALNRITKTTFDGLNRPTKVEFADTTTRWSYYTPGGQVWKVVDELGRETLTQYDQAGRPVEVTLPPVNGVSAITKTAYDAAGNVIAVQDPLGNITTSVYDSRNRPTKVIAPYVWDAVVGAWIQPEVSTTYDAAGNVLAVTDALGAVTTHEYDKASRLLRTTDASGHVAEQEYDANGNVRLTRDALKREVKNTYDACNRLVTTEDAEGQVTTFVYDKNGNRTSLTDPRGKVTTFTYDGLNRLKKETFPEGVWVEHFYDAVRETSREDSAGREFTFDYDLRDRLTGTTWTVGGSPVTRTRVYDGLGKLTSVTETGRPEATVGYTYDELNRVATETSQGLTHTYTYDLAGRRTQSALGTGRVVVTEYDHHGRTSAITEGGRTTRYYYDAGGRTVALRQPNGSWQYNGYDAIGRLVYRQMLTASHMVVGQMLWTHDAVGNVTSQSERWPGYAPASGAWTTTGMAYDGCNRLVGECRATWSIRVSSTGYAYDAGGNRILEMQFGNPQQSTSYAYNDFNQLTGWTKRDATEVTTQTAVLSYDGAGNRTTKVLASPSQPSGQTTTYHWDAENRLKGVTLFNGVEHEYQYDYRMRRIGRLENGVGSAIVFSGGLSVAEYAVSGPGPVVEYLRGPDMGGGVGGMLYSLRDGGTSASYTLSNGRGDVVARSDANGAVKWKSRYTSFGQPLDNTSGTNLDRQRANSKEQDPTGLLNEGFRYRDLETGVWLSRDPAGFVDGPNLYAYVQQNPWTSFDPEGLWVEDAVIGIPSLCMGAKSFWDNAWAGNGWSATLDAVGVVVDGTAIAVPGVPGGAGIGIKASRMALKAADKVNDGVDAYEKAQTVVEVAQAAASGDSSKLVEVVVEVGKDKLTGKKKGKGDGSSPTTSQRDTTNDAREVVNDATKTVGSTRHIELEKANNGAYTVEFDSDKTYDGKGGTDRARRSARQRSRANNDPVKTIEHTPAENDTDAFRMEAENLEKHGGPDSPNNYNEINSPGKKKK